MDNNVNSDVSLSLPNKGALALGGAALLGVAALSANGSKAFAQAAPFSNDLDILNYALTLEYFESSLYKYLLTLGKLQGKDLQYVTLFADHEQQHVNALVPTIQKLGGTPVTIGNYNFPNPATRDDLLNVLATVEAVGMAAYQGASVYIQNKDLLAAAGSIMQAEARHTAVIRDLLGVVPAPDPIPKPMSKDEVLAAVAPFIK